MKNITFSGIMALVLAASAFSFVPAVSEAAIPFKLIASQSLTGMRAYDSSNASIPSGSVVRGDKLTVAWNSKNIQIVTILLNTTSGNLVRLIASGTNSSDAAHQSYSWNVPKDIAKGNYIVWMTSGDRWFNQAVTLNII